MINGIEGIPGSGKSYEAVAYHVLPALQAGRKVITNLPLNVDAFAAIDPSYRQLIEVRTRPAPQIGEWNAANIAEQEAFKLWKDREPVQQSENVFTFGTVWDYYSDWRGPKGEGPLYVIDECHVALPKLGTPDSVVQWFKLHRHYNAEVLLMTQSFRDINQPIAQLVATLIKCRKADILGNKGEYIRKVHAGYRGAMIQQNQRKYENQYFGLYRSNTQSSGTSEAGMTDVKPMIVYFNRAKWAWLAVTLGLVVWAFWPKPDVDVWGNKKVQPKSKATAPAASPVAATVVPTATPKNTQASAQSQDAEQAKAEDKEPLKGKSIHVTGEILKHGKHWYTFVVSDGTRRMFDLTSDDMKAAGYQVAYKAHCIAQLSWEGGGSRMVMCDAPNAPAGTDNKPIVIDSGGGGRSDRPLRTGAQPEGTQQQLEQAEYRPPQYQQHATMADISKAGRTARLVDSGQL